MSSNPQVDNILKPTTLQESIDSSLQSDKPGLLRLSTGDETVKLVTDKSSQFVPPLPNENIDDPSPPLQHPMQPQPVNISLNTRSDRARLSVWAKGLAAVIGGFRGMAKGFGMGAASGAVVGAAGGAIAGAAGGSVALPVVGTLAGAGIGAAAGAVAGGAGGGLAGAAGGFGYGLAQGWDQLSHTLFASGKRPQNIHANNALNSLRNSGWQPGNAASQNLDSVTDQEWRELLHVPKEYKYSPHSWSSGVSGRQNRQKIREAVLLYVAEHGKAGAKRFRQNLISAARRSPAALQTEINKLKAGYIADRMSEIDRMPSNDIRAKSLAFTRLVGANADFFTHPSSLFQGNDSVARVFKTRCEHFGLQAALGIVDRIEQRGVVTKQDNDDLNRALNILGKSDRDAYRGISGIKDVLKKGIGKPMPPELKHKVAQAIHQQFGDPDASYGVNVYSNERKKLENALDPSGFQNAGNEQRASVANSEIEALRTAGLEALQQDTMVQEIVHSLLEPLQTTAQSFQPGQPTLPPQPQVAVSQQQLNPDRNLPRLQSLMNDYAPPRSGIGPGGAQFERIKTALDLKDGEYDPKALRAAIAQHLTQVFGRNGIDMPDDKPENQVQLHQGAETAVLRAITGQMIDARLSSQDNRVLPKRAEQLEQRANDWAENGMPDSQALQTAKSDYSSNSKGKAISALMSDLKLQSGDLPEDIQQRINQRLEQLFRRDPLNPPGSDEVNKAIASLVVGAAVELADSNEATFAQQQRAVYAGARHEARYQDNPGSYLRSNTGITAHLTSIVARNDNGYVASVVNGPKKQAFNGDPASMLIQDLEKPKTEEQYRNNLAAPLRDQKDLLRSRDQAKANIDTAMTAIIGSKENNSNQRDEAVKAVPPKLRQLLASVDQGARDGCVKAGRDPLAQDNYARAGVLNSFVLRNLVPSYTSPNKTLQIKPWHPPIQRETMPKLRSVIYQGNVVTTIFNAAKIDKNFVPMSENSPNQHHNQKAKVINPMMAEVKNVRDDWREPAGVFLQQLVKSGQELNQV